jgi:hypothetical protein
MTPSNVTHTSLSHHPPHSLLLSASSLYRAEKDALDNVRRSIEAELDRCRIELSGMRTLARDTEQDGQAAFEVEKLLGALKTTMDQMSASIAVAGNATSHCAVL